MGSLRITSGEYRNRRLDVPETGEVRPMLEKPRMAVFSILGQDFCAGYGVIDAFAGTGILGFECLSRGAKAALFLDTQSEHVTAIQAFATKLGCAERIRSVRGDVMRELSGEGWANPDAAKGKLVPAAVRWMPSVRMVFVDPPHAYGNEPTHPFHGWFERLGDMPGLAEDAVIVYGHHGYHKPPARTGARLLFDTRTYGEVGFSLYGAEGEAEGHENGAAE